MGAARASKVVGASEAEFTLVKEFLTDGLFTGKWCKLVGETWGHATFLQTSGMARSHSYEGVGIVHLKV